MERAVDTLDLQELPMEQQVLIDEYLVEIKRLNAQMELERKEIDRLKLETVALKSETEKLKIETRATLSRLGVAV